VSDARLYCETVPPPGDRRLKRRLLLIGVSLCGLVILVAVMGLAGGLDRVTPAGLPVVAVNEPSQGEPWNVTVSHAVLAADLSPATLQEEDGYWLAVIADVEITADESRIDLDEILYVTGVQGLGRDRLESSIFPGGLLADDIRLFRDASAAGALHPGLPERLAFLWELAGGAPPPAEVHVEIVGKVHRKDVLTGQMSWLDAAPRAQLTVPVEDRRDRA
jgi:hypothetical protein